MKRFYSLECMLSVLDEVKWKWQSQFHATDIKKAISTDQRLYDIVWDAFLKVLKTQILYDGCVKYMNILSYNTILTVVSSFQFMWTLKKSFGKS